MPTAERLREWFSSLVRHTQGGSRAPHKPLVLLDALARVARGEPRLELFGDAEPRLNELLVRFGRPGAAPRSQYPFFRLCNDADGQLWELDRLHGLRALENEVGDVPVTSLRLACGGFTKPVFDLIAGDRRLPHDLSGLLLEEFPQSIQEDLLDAIGLPWQAINVGPRDPAFREQVLRAYERRCAICDFDGRLGAGNEFALEAAHIRWHAYGGSDAVDNGLALCSLHHKAFDRGAVALTDDYRLLVSAELSGVNIAPFITNYAGREVRRPSSASWRARTDYLRWHREEVFRAPAREA